MSAEASNWARRMQTGSPSTKGVLMVLADIADNEGHIRFISPDYLSECSELSRAAVFKHLRRLEAGGVLRREPGSRRDDGALVVTGQLLVGEKFAPPGAGETGEGGDQVSENEEVGRGESTRWTGGESTTWTGGSSTWWTGGSPRGGLPPYI